MKKIRATSIFLVMLITISSCHYLPQKHFIRPKPYDQDLMTRTKELHKITESLRCGKSEGWNEAKEEARLIALHTPDNDPQFRNVKAFEENLKNAERDDDSVTVSKP